MGATRTAVLHLLSNRIFWKHFVNGVQRLGGIYTGRSRLIIGRVFIVLVYIENTSWKVLGYGIYARVVDLSEIDEINYFYLL